MSKVYQRTPTKASTNTSTSSAPQQPKPSKKSPTKRSASTSARSPSPSKRSRAASPTKEPISLKSRGKSPIKKSSPQKPSTTTTTTTNPYARPHPPHPSRGTMISPTNPPTISTLTNKPNPFHETLPAPEIWHRRMPPYFPFGETRFMEREISLQIEADLARGAEETQQARQKSEPTELFKRASSFVSGTVDAVRNTFSPAKPRRKLPGAWELPGVREVEVERLVPLVGSSGASASRQVSAPRIQSRYRGNEDDYGSSDDGTSGLH